MAAGLGPMGSHWVHGAAAIKQPSMDLKVRICRKPYGFHDMLSGGAVEPPELVPTRHSESANFQFFEATDGCYDDVSCILRGAQMIDGWRLQMLAEVQPDSGCIGRDQEPVKIRASWGCPISSKPCDLQVCHMKPCGLPHAAKVR